MKIKKTFQGNLPDNKVVNEKTESQTDAYSCDYINELTTYSTEEQVIGKWIDGKTLYRRVVEITTTATGMQQISCDFSNVNEITRIEAKAKLDSNYDLPITYHTSETNYCQFYIRTTENLIYINNAMNTAKYICILEYTKTTD